MKIKILLYITMIGISCACMQKERADVAAVHEFISSSWDKTIRMNKNDEGTLIGLPYPYTVPSISGMFQEMYYWDTFFTGEGLIIDGRLDQAIYNIENMLYMVERFGKMLNGTRTGYINRSQPPYLSMMIMSVYRQTKDKAWLSKILPVLEKEYFFWMTERITPLGLNRYGNSAEDKTKMNFVKLVKSRLGDAFNVETYSDKERLVIGSHYISEAESGWDFNPRFNGKCEDFCPVDLNSNLFIYEKNFAFYYSELGDKEKTEFWNEKAEGRKRLMTEYMVDDKSGYFYDYDYVNGVRSDVVSAAVFHPMFANLVTDSQARKIIAALDVLEYQYGISACENKNYPYVYQWSFPNGWAPLNYIVIKALDNYGFENDAKRIAEKYVDIICKNFLQTGNLWEKYNVVEGNINVSNEYEMPHMLGWTAGTFLWAADYLGYITKK